MWFLFLFLYSFTFFFFDASVLGIRLVLGGLVIGTGMGVWLAGWNGIG